MAEWQSGDVTANGIRIHYSRTGGDKPPVVLNHGATDNGLCWTRVARALEGDYDVIMPDARGHGRSDAPEQGYTAKDRAADLAGLIRALGLERPAVGGHSMGAGTAFQLAVDHPDLPRCAILEDPGFRQPGAEPPRRGGPAQWMAELRGLSREEIMARGRAQNPTWDEAEFGPWADAKRQVSPNFSNPSRPMDRLNWTEDLPKIRVPVLLITGDPDRGGIVTPEVAAEAERLQPRLRVVHLAGAGHNVRRERFDAFVEAVRAFLDETMSDG